jgi:putative redox protein
MDATVTWKGRMSFSGTADTGFILPLGTNSDVGGDNDGFRPLELFAISLAGCSGMDVISILKKKKQDVTGYEVRVHAEQREERPHVFTHITVEHVVTGRQVSEEAVRRSIELSVTKYCAAQAMLSQVTQIEHTYLILEAA